MPKGKKASEGGYQPQDKNSWIPQGEKMLRIMCETTNMLPIGEDLGSIPKEVYLNLQKLVRKFLAFFYKYFFYELAVYHNINFYLGYLRN